MVTPNSGSAAGGTPIALTGTNLRGIINVSVGGAPATSVVVNPSFTQITAITPPGTPGATDITVSSTTSGSAMILGGFTFVAGNGLTLQPPIQFLTFKGIEQLILGDFNGDGKLAWPSRSIPPIRHWCS